MMAAYMILLHGLREVFGVMPPPKRGPGAFMALDSLGTGGGVLLLVLAVLFFVGWLVRPAALIFAIQCVAAYFYAAMPRGAWPIRNGGIDALTYALVFLYLAAVGAGAWSVDGLLKKRHGESVQGA
jgi:putative oxidoreductase